MKLESNHTLNIEAFVDADEVDVIYQDTPYYLAPDGAMAEETFIVLREAMREAGKVAIARLVLSSRERVVTIGRAREGDVRLDARAPNEVRATSAYFDEIPDAKPDTEMLELAEALIKQKTTKFDPTAYEDRYETALMAMIKEKLKGHKPIIAAEPAARQRRQPDGRAEGEPRAGEAAGAEQGQGAGGGEAGGASRGRRPRPRREPWTGRASASSGRWRRLPRRLAARAVERRGGQLHRGVTRRTGIVVFGRRLLRGPDAAVERRVAAARAPGRVIRSEGGFLRLVDRRGGGRADRARAG